MTLLLRLMPPMLLAITLAGVSSVDAQLYRWVDEDGNVHYTDRLPPERAPDARTVYSRDGAPIEEVERAPTEEELAEQERQRRLEQARLEQEQETRRQQAEYDRMLLRTFNDEAHLQNVRQERLDALEAQQRMLRMRNARDGEELESRGGRGAPGGRAGGGGPAALYARIRRTEERMAEREARMADLERGMDHLNREFDGHLQRFRELKRGNR
ncbi:MAG: DUF4124 domain-containing protein [Ectothiorhodospiraceae bacterium]|nr:DUF4124 domain-containing protein [Ectothiorhodospiraceae bacterium]